MFEKDDYSLNKYRENQCIYSYARPNSRKIKIAGFEAVERPCAISRLIGHWFKAIRKVVERRSETEKRAQPQQEPDRFGAENTECGCHAVQVIVADHSDARCSCCFIALGLCGNGGLVGHGF